MESLVAVARSEIENREVFISRASLGGKGLCIIGEDREKENMLQNKDLSPVDPPLGSKWG